MITLSSILDRAPRAHGLLSAAVVTGCMAMCAVHLYAFGEGSDGGGDSGGDATVGTLPMTSDDESALDQTLTLRGNVIDIRAALVDATGVGSVDVIALGDGDALLRFYGDVRIELDLSALATLEMGIWAGFEGGGMAYAVGTPDGLGSPSTLESGYTMDLDPIRYANVGLLDEPLSIHAFHRIGVRTRTTVELRSSAGTVVFFQDV